MFLAPPGAGKSTELENLVRSLGDGAALVSLGSSDSEDRLVGRISRAVNRIVGGPGALLALDSLDECSLTTTALAGLIEEVAADLPSGARLALACRTAAWLPGVERVLRQSFSDVAIFDLAPLAEDDVAAYARSAGVDEAAFIGALRKANAMALAASPKTLELLVDQYLSGDLAIPGTQRDLFERTCRRLVTEPNPLRRRPLAESDVPGLVDAAGRLAVLSLFTARASFALSAEPASDCLTAEDCEEPGYSEVLRTALFESAGEDRLRFMHQTIVEFLAARYLVGLGLSPVQLDALLRGRGGRLAPQVQAVAAWLIALDPSRFAGLLDDDPVSFLRSSVELTDPVYRRNLVERLLELAQRFELPNFFFGTRLDGLAYDGVVDRLRDVLIDPAANADVEYLAIGIAVSNRLTSLAGTLVELALDDRRSVPTRTGAGRAALDLADAATTRPLAVLADPETAPADREDQLFGVGLRALLHGGLSPTALLSRLRPPENPDFFGSYRSLLTMELPSRFGASALSVDEARDALAWVADLESSANPLAGPAEKLCDAVLLAGLRRLDSVAVRTEVVRLIRIRLETRNELFRERRSTLPELPDQVRRELLLALRHELTDTELAWDLQDSGLVGPGELVWLLDRASAAATDEEAQRWSPWLSLAYDRTRPDHQAALRAVPEASPLYRQTVQSLLQPPAPRRRSNVERVSLPIADEIRHRLVESLTLDASEAFPAFSRYVEFRAGNRLPHDSLNPRITSLPGWALLNEDQWQLAVSAAQRYLPVATDNGEDLLGVDKYRPSVVAVVRALVLLAQYDIVPDLEQDRWRFLAPAIVQSLFGSSNDSAVIRALRWVSEKAADAMLAAAEKEMRGQPEHSEFTLRDIAPVLTPAMVPWLVRLIDDETVDGGAAFERLLGLDEQAALAMVRTAVANRTELLRRLAVITVARTGSAGWALVREPLMSDSALAEYVVGELADGREFQATTLNEADVVELWELTQRRFPPDEDPVVYGAHWVGRRETIGNFRDRLLPALAERGTIAAVVCLRRLADSRPDNPGLKRLTAQARAALGRADWSPLLPPEVVEVLSSARRVMRNDEDLLHAVLEGIDQTQLRLQGATPAATFLWNHGPSCTPKTEDEISDYLNAEIERSVPGIVVNREVQVTRLRTSGIGQRVDLLVQALAPADSDRVLRVVIEVKGNWNDEIKDALESQLVERYLAKWTGATGIFLVAWFDPAHGAKPGTWRRDPIRGKQAALAANLADRAARATAESGHIVRAVVLDCSTAVRCADRS
ncbi:hypothetical protein [Micromonospora sp. 4G55]|uniref:hypothetical protein n=1 Tax=Micromonospora sp. 4G55 TaxID=2806102 RepID=UPI001A56C14D|nr:hypothetical protein [Micromonospora sp. 4G55]MBM0255515.1 hypothetical protein [Micromonospora sp. 4G55]